MKLLIISCSNIVDEYGIKIGVVNKMITNLANESKYVLHYKNFQLYLSLGMKLFSVHRTLKLKQSDWLKKYIDYNTDKWKNTGNSFETDFHKLMKNSVCGKTMEKLRKKIKC